MGTSSGGFFSPKEKKPQEDQKTEYKELKEAGPSQGFFTLPLIGHLGKKDWILDEKNWIVDQESIELFKNARDGQGFSGITYVELDEKTNQLQAVTKLTLVYNAGDGLAKEDKIGNKYYPSDYIESKAIIGQSGVGVIHKNSLENEILKTSGEYSELEKKSSAAINQLRENYSMKAAEFRGFTFGTGITKGAESTDAKDYSIVFLKSKNDIEILQKSFKEKKSDAIKLSTDYSNKSLILIENEDKYEVYYLLNGKLVPPPYSKEKNIPSVKKQDIDTATKKEEQIHQCLNALNLHQRISIKNKSATLNNFSIIYYPDFENLIMYLDPEKYLLNKNKKLEPEGKEWGSLYDVDRSVAIPLMMPLSHSLISSLALTEEETKQYVDNQRKNWSSWGPEYPYDKVISDFQAKSPKEKIEILQNNIHITVHLYLVTLQAFVLACETYKCRVEEAEKRKISYTDNAIITAFPYNHPIFNNPFDVNGGLILNDFMQYFSSLIVRLEHLVLAIDTLRNSSDPTISLESKCSLDWLEGGNHKLENILNQCKLISEYTGKLMEEVGNFLVSRTLSELFQEIITSITTSHVIKQNYQNMVNWNVSSLLLNFSYKNKAKTIQSFWDLLRNMSYLYSPDTISEQVSSKLSEKDLSKKTALFYAVKNGWYDMAEILVSYGVNMQPKIFEMFIKKISTEEKSSISALDFHLSNIIRKTKMEPTIVATLIKEIERNKNSKMPLTIALLNELRSSPQSGNQHILYQPKK